MADYDVSPHLSETFVSGSTSNQLEALLKINEMIAQQHDLKALFHDLAEHLHAILQFDFLSLVLHHPERNTMSLHVLETRGVGDRPPATEFPVRNHPAGWVWETQQPFVTLDTANEMRYPEIMRRMQEGGVHSVAILPLTTAQHRLGAVGFGRLGAQAITSAELEFMSRIAAQVALAVDNALNYEAAQAYQGQLARERDRLQLLLRINNLLVSTRDPTALFEGIVSALKPVLRQDFTSLALFDEPSGLVKMRALDLPSNSELSKTEMVVSLEESPAGRCFTSGQAVIARGAELNQFRTKVMQFLRREGVQSIACMPLATHGRRLGTINLASRDPDAFSSADQELLQQVATQVAIALDNALAFKQIDALKNKLAVEKLYLEEEIRSEFNFEEIVGDSPALRKTLSQVELAAPTTATVMVLGETGTGKELIARAIHNLSPRRARTFVKVNCAAIPAGLLESELFGHERGAFTGALTQKIGRFEFADGGTLFLDEVADLPLELQPKLLRVLQEQEFERLGNNNSIRVDVRVVAATNANLAQLVEEKKFRSDLFYRLNVFPIVIPPLRERREDVPLLVRYFVQIISRRLNRTVEYVPAQVMEALVNYSWPGNVRELENLIERAVLLSPGRELQVPLAELRSPFAAADQFTAPRAFPNMDVESNRDSAASDGSTTLDETQRQHILKVLRQTGWRISGPKGAAQLLGIKRTTLQARMRKLGISRPV